MLQLFLETAEFREHLKHKRNVKNSSYVYLPREIQVWMSFYAVHVTW